MAYFPFRNIKNNFSYVIQILDLTFINISSILNKEIINPIKLTKKIDSIIYLIKSKNNYLDFTYQSIIETYKNMLIWFVNNYKFKSNINKNLINNFFIKEAPILTDNDEITISSFINDITPEQVINGLNDIKTNINDLLIFLTEAFEKFKNNFYGSYLIKTDNQVDHSFSVFKNTKNVNLKNIYNYAKSLSIYNFDNSNILSKNFKALEKEFKIDFINRFFEKVNHSEWFKIHNVIKRQENNRNLNNFKLTKFMIILLMILRN